MKKKSYLFIGGPLHAQWIEVKAEPVIDDSVSARVVDGQPAPPDEDDAFPEVFANIEHATHYVRRTVNHVDHSTGHTYLLRVFVWEGITDPNAAQMHLGDAVAHRYFIEHGALIESADTVAEKRYGSLIIPGR